MRILGVEFGAWSIKAVEMESRFRRVEILDFHEVRLPLQIIDPQAVYREAVGKLLARLPSVPEKISISLPPSQTAVRFLKIPVKQRKTVERMYRFELEDNLPLKLEDAIVEHYVQRTPEGSLVLAAVAPKKLIRAQLDWIKGTGLDPDWLTFDGMGMLNVYLSRILEKKDERPLEPLLLLDIGHVKTNIAVVHEDRLEFFRSIPWGGASVNNAIALSLGLSIEESEQLKISELRLDSDSETLEAKQQDLLIASTQAFASFITEITHAMVAYRTTYGKDIKAAEISGGTSKTWGLESFLAAALQLKVSRFHPFTGLSLKEEIRESADETRFAEALGRAQVFARKAPLLFNFRREELSKETSLLEISDFLKNPNTSLLARFAAVLALILFGHVTIARRLADQEAKLAQDDVRKVFSETFRAVPPKLRQSLTTSPTSLRKYIDTKNNEMKQRLKMAAKGREPMLNMLLSISNSFPVDVKVDVNVLQIDDRSMLMEGVLYEGDLNQVVNQLKANKNLNKVTLAREGQRFTVRGEVVGR